MAAWGYKFYLRVVKVSLTGKRILYFFMYFSARFSCYSCSFFFLTKSANLTNCFAW